MILYLTNVSCFFTTKWRSSGLYYLHKENKQKDPEQDSSACILGHLQGVQDKDPEFKLQWQVAI